MVQVFVLIIGIIFLQGCASTSKTSSNLQDLQNRIALLEAENSNKNSEIENLREELQELRAVQDEGQTIGLSEQRGSYKSLSYGETEKNLYPDILRVGGVSAGQLQQALLVAGFYKGSIDGKIGPKTIDAIKAFQRANNLKIDGVVGKETWSRLKNNL